MIILAFATFAALMALAALRAPIFVWSAALGVLGAAWAVILASARPPTRCAAPYYFCWPRGSLCRRCAAGC
jgi:hypothetical protein